MKKIVLHLICLFAAFNITAGTVYKYKIDLTIDFNDRLLVTLECPEITTDEVVFNFPKTIPGTYATENYGVYIDKFVANTLDGKKLKAKKISENSWRISGAKNLKTITYLVNDTWDAGVKKNKIFEPAGTNFEFGKCYTINNSGLFGYFSGMEKQPVEVEVIMPQEFIGVSSLKGSEGVITRKVKMGNETIETPGKKMLFKAKNYHQLVDCPMQFAKADTALFKLGETLVTIGVYNESGEPAAKLVFDEIKNSLVAAQQFLGKLPVDNYTFIIYIKDFKKIMEEYQSGKMGLIKKLKLARRFGGQGFGALEHDNSSLYFLPDFGHRDYIQTMKDVAIHEFMHIITPLNLHSENIGDFNYIDPKMSQHLWLYEGITEYNAGLIQLQGGLLDTDSYLKKVIKDKMQSASAYPTAKMSFTEMSRNVLNEPFKTQYMQVYSRGALMGLLLDIEIMHLTKGEKTLKEVVVSLSKKYGPDKSFNEESFIKEFVASVHPDLQKFFDHYVNGREELDYEGALNKIGIIFKKEFTGTVPLHPVLNNDVKYKFSNKNGGVYTITEVGPGDFAGLKKGDMIYEMFISQAYDDPAMMEGDEITLTVVRGGVVKNGVNIKYKVKMGQGTIKNYLKLNPSMSDEQRRLFERWSKS